MGDTAVDADEVNGCLNCNQVIGKKFAFGALFLRIFRARPAFEATKEFPLLPTKAVQPRAFGVSLDIG
jgi:hypothetical protein